MATLWTLAQSAAEDGALTLRASGECSYTLYVGDYFEEHGYPVLIG